MFCFFSCDVQKRIAIVSLVIGISNPETGSIKCFLVLLVAGLSNYAYAQGSKTCYPHVGCYENGPPWSSLVRPALPPQDPAEVKPFMYYYGRNLHKGKTFQVYPKVDFNHIPYDKNKDTYVLIHGFTDNGKLPWLLRLKDVLLKKMDVNVFILDYSKGANGLYIQAAGNIRVYGKLYARALKASKIPSSKIHIIGHSLGGHLASYICKELNSMGHRVGWLTGLDIAAPLFEIFPNITRFDVSDADFVDVHHSNVGVRGYVLPHGHIDVFYNSGTTQSRCELKNEYDDYQKKLVQYGASSCYHHMCHEYYINSIEYGCMYGLPSSMMSKLALIKSNIMRKKVTKVLNHSCYPDSCLQIGLGMRDSPLRGIFTVKTYDYPPYCSKIYPLLS